MIVLNGHYGTLLDVPEAVLSQLLEDTRALSRAINESFSPPNLNYLMLGNTVRHAHFHVVPRYPNAPRWGLSPLLPVAGEYEHLHPNDYRRIADRIRIELEKTTKA